MQSPKTFPHFPSYNPSSDIPHQRKKEKTTTESHTTTFPCPAFIGYRFNVRIVSVMGIKKFIALEQQEGRREAARGERPPISIISTALERLLV